MRGLGLFLTIAGMIGVFVWVFVPVASEDSHPFYQQVYCMEAEAFIVRTSAASGGGTNYTFWCESEDRTLRDVTGVLIVSGIGGGGLVTALGFMMLFMFRGKPTVTVSTPQVFTMSTSSGQKGWQGVQVGSPASDLIQMDDGVIKMPGMEIRLDQMPGIDPKHFQQSGFQMQEDLSFAESLRQLDEARNAGLITAGEYELLRRKIMDRFEDRSDGM